jgi:exo-beta-1,3-glucanase (GH17 family)
MRDAESAIETGVSTTKFAGATPAGTFAGINYGPFHESGEQPGTPIPESQFKSDLGILSQKFTYIKTYGDDQASNLNLVVPIAAKYFPQFKIYQGVFENAFYKQRSQPDLSKHCHQPGEPISEYRGGNRGRQRMP